CIFCGLSGHFIPDCMVCQSYLNEGKCKRNVEGKIILPSGQFTPQSIPGRFIKECIDEWWKRNPDTTLATTLLFSIAPSALPTSTNSTSAVITNLSCSDTRKMIKFKQYNKVLLGFLPLPLKYLNLLHQYLYLQLLSHQHFRKISMPEPCCIRCCHLLLDQTCDLGFDLSLSRLSFALHMMKE
ncbi:hypothetical protein L208DRAFT_1314327, partial [Tricholoma matsutake]